MTFLEVFLTSEVRDDRFAAQRNKTFRVRASCSNSSEEQFSNCSNQIFSPRKKCFSNNYGEHTDNENVFTVIVLNYTERVPLGCNI